MISSRAAMSRHLSTIGFQQALRFRHKPILLHAAIPSKSPNVCINPQTNISSQAVRAYAEYFKTPRKNPYIVLDISPDALPAEIKKAWNSKAQITHPDAGGDSALFKETKDAIDILQDPLLRQVWRTAYFRSHPSSSASLKQSSHTDISREPQRRKRTPKEEEADKRAKEDQEERDRLKREERLWREQDARDKERDRLKTEAKLKRDRLRDEARLERERIYKEKDKDRAVEEA